MESDTRNDVQNLEAKLRAVELSLEAQEVITAEYRDRLAAAIQQIDQLKSPLHCDACFGSNWVPCQETDSGAQLYRANVSTYWRCGYCAQQTELTRLRELISTYQHAKVAWDTNKFTDEPEEDQQRYDTLTRVEQALLSEPPMTSSGQSVQPDAQQPLPFSITLMLLAFMVTL